MRPTWFKFLLDEQAQEQKVPETAGYASSSQPLSFPRDSLAESFLNINALAC